MLEVELITLLISFFIIVPLTCWQAWESSLATLVSFSEDSTARHLVMFETSSNTSAWCYFMMHTLYAWCVLTLSEVRSGHAPFVYLSLTHMAWKTKAHESSAVVNSCREWARDRLMLIGTKLGSRAKDSVLRMYPLISHGIAMLIQISSGDHLSELIRSSSQLLN
jgi:hypothetical protein